MAEPGTLWLSHGSASNRASGSFKVEGIYSYQALAWWVTPRKTLLSHQVTANLSRFISTGMEMVLWILNLKHPPSGP